MSTARTAVLVALAIVVQVTLIAPLGVLGARGDLVLLVAVAAGLVGGRDRGAKVGFAAGLTFDLLLSSPAGLSALTCTLVAYGVGAFGESVLRYDRRLVVATAVVASGAGVVLYRVLGALIGRGGTPSASLVVIVVVVAAINGVLAVPAVGAARWARADEVAGPHPDRVLRS